jgi:hypothetical protein
MRSTSDFMARASQKRDQAAWIRKVSNAFCTPKDREYFHHQAAELEQNAGHLEGEAARTGGPLYGD